MGLIPAQSGVFIQPKTPFAAIKHTLSPHRSTMSESHILCVCFLLRLSVRSISHQFSLLSPFSPSIKSASQAKTQSAHLRAVCLGLIPFINGVFQFSSWHPRAPCLKTSPADADPRRRYPNTVYTCISFIRTNTSVPSHFINTRAHNNNQVNWNLFWPAAKVVRARSAAKFHRVRAC